MFEEKMESFTQELKGRFIPPNLHKEYLFFDFIEIYSFFYNDEVTKDEIENYFGDTEVDILKYFSNFLEFNDDDDNHDEDNNVKESVINFTFECLKQRENLLGEKYPFIINNNSISLKEDLTIVQKIYLCLLFSSMLDRFMEFKSFLTTDFESITYCSLIELFPNYKVKEFGKNTDYTGSAREKILQLAKDLNVPEDTNEIRTIHLRNNQEKGLDLVLWKPFKDKIPNMPIYLVQCACGKDWTKKFSEVKRYFAYLNFKKPDPGLLFSTPYALNCNNSFYQNDDVISSESLLLDRFRILECLNTTACLEEKALNSLSLVEKLVQLENILD